MKKPLDQYTYTELEKLFPNADPATIQKMLILFRDIEKSLRKKREKGK